MFILKKKVLAIGEKSYYQSNSWKFHWIDLNKNPDPITINENEYDAICIKFNSSASAESTLDWLEKSKNSINESIPIIAISSIWKIDFYIRALDQGIAGIHCQQGDSFKSQENEIASLINSLVEYKPSFKLSFLSTNKRLHQQINFIIEEMSTVSTGRHFIIQGGFGSGLLLDKVLKSALRGVLMEEINCEKYIDFNDIEQKEIIIIHGLEYSTESVQLQILELVQKVRKVVIFLSPDFTTALEKGFNENLHKWMFKNCSTIDFPSLSSILSNKKESLIFEELIEFFLNDRTVCPIHLKAYFGKSTFEVFTFEAIDTLKKYQWPYNIEELREVVQKTIARIFLEKTRATDYPKLDKHFLPSRFEKKINLGDNWEKRAREFFDVLREKLKEYDNSIVSVAKHSGTTLLKIKEELLSYKEVYQNNPLDVNFSLCIEAFQKPVIFLCYHPKSEPIYDLLIKHLKQIPKSMSITIERNQHLLAGDNIKQTIAKKMETAWVIGVITCADYFDFKPENLNELESWNYLEEHYKHHEVIPIIAKTCSWNNTFLLQFAPVPINRKPINQYNGNQKDQIGIEIATNIIKKLDRMIINNDVE